MNISEYELIKCVTECIKKQCLIKPLKHKKTTFFEIALKNENLLEEGYFKTFDIDFILRYICKTFNFTIDNRLFSTGEYNGLIQTDDECILILLPSDYDITAVNKAMKLCGFLLDSKEELYDGQFIKYDYEKKWGNKINDELKMINALYHVSPSIYEEKILNYGLEPRNKNKQFEYDERIYLFIDKLYALSIGEALYNSLPDLDKKYKNEFTLYKIGIEELINKIKIYKDPKLDNGYYTKENIPPKYITKIKNFNYK